MKLIWLLTLLLGAPASAQSFQILDRVDGWLIERKLTEQQQPICRASIPSGGTWFSARIRLDRSDNLIIPKGLSTPEKESIDLALKALALCRSSILYF